MPKPRKQLISLEATPYYHCTSRCVRRAFLCGFDRETGKSFEHRRQWIEGRILLLGDVFTLDVCAYAVMSNHHHVVLYVNQHQSEQLSTKDICSRWHKIYKGTLLTQRFERNEPLTNAELTAVQEKIEEWREKLCSISWFMRALNEPIARMANAEDNCTGRFWESRFTSQALLDEKALIACMAYVDLNPIRAKMAELPESSNHTSVKRRIHQLKKDQTQPAYLAKFVGNPREPMPVGLPFQLHDYLELIDWTGRQVREDKRGFIPPKTPPVLNRLQINTQQWIVLATQFERQFKSFVGSRSAILSLKNILGFKRSTPLGASDALFC